MKKVLLISGCLLALTAGAAAAAGLNLGWSNCVGGAGSTLDNAFACNTNTGTNVLFGSYVAPGFLTEVNGNEMVLDLQTSAGALSPWWSMGTGGCTGRTGLPTASFDFTGGPFDCIDYWAGGASGGLAYNRGFGGLNRARILLVCAIPEVAAGPIATGDHVYSFKVSISNVRTVGTGLCAGCTDAACIVLNSIKITQNVTAPGGAKFLANPALSNYVTWRGGLPPPSGCLGATPARNATWGSVKSLYR